MSGKFKFAALAFRDAFEKASCKNVAPSTYECMFCGSPWMGALGQAPHRNGCVSFRAYELLQAALDEEKEEAKRTEAETMANAI